MVKPRTLVLRGYGVNCDEETKFAFEKAGASADLVHVNDLIANERSLNDYQILVFPGGFSFGDDTGAGNALADRIRNHLWNDVRKFVDQDKLVLGICNGFQVLTNLGLVPGFDGKYGERSVALLHNDSARYNCRWVDVGFNTAAGPWVNDIVETHRMSLPVAHGEGKFYADSNILKKLNDGNQIAAKYVPGEICEYQNLSHNPNGSLEDIAAITDASGKILGMMPHPERAIDFTHLPNWTLLKEQYKREEKEIPTEGPGMFIFRNGVHYLT